MKLNEKQKIIVAILVFVALTGSMIALNVMKFKRTPTRVSFVIVIV